MRVLVTGGAGFIGSHTVERFLEEGWEVVVLDNFRTGRRENISHLSGRFELHTGSVEDRSLLEALLMEADAVVHLAAVPSVVESFEFPVETASINVSGTISVLEGSRRADVEKVVFSSSSAIYGDGYPLPLKEDLPPRPLSNYAVTKVAGEHLMGVYSRVYGLRTVSLRYFNVYGPRQNPESEYAAVVPKFLTALSRGETPVIYGDGEQSRDFIYVRDVAEVNYLSVVRDIPGGEVFNVASGIPTTIHELLRTVEEVVGRRAQPRYEPPRPGDIRHSLADVEKLKKMLDFTPRYSLKEGLREMYTSLTGVHV